LVEFLDVLTSIDRAIKARPYLRMSMTCYHYEDREVEEYNIHTKKMEKKIKKEKVVTHRASRSL
jgi:hypothetical protein